VFVVGAAAEELLSIPASLSRVGGVYCAQSKQPSE
jgi:hypothetical protein